MLAVKNPFYLTLLMLLLTLTFSPALSESFDDTDLPFRFALKYEIDDIMNNTERAEEFIKEYLEWEAEFFAIAREPLLGLTYDGYNLNKDTGLPEEVRYWSAPSKECLDIAICIKALSGDPYAAIVVSKEEPEKAKEIAANILERKMFTYRVYYEENPGYGGFLPWYYIREETDRPHEYAGDLPDSVGEEWNRDIVVTPADDWIDEVPGLDNGEWAWTLLVAERVLREEGYIRLADDYAAYIEMLRANVVEMFYDEEAGKVRGDVHILSPDSPESEYERAENKCAYLTGEHGVHEGVMMVLFVTLFGKGLPEDARERIWSDISMKRIEHKYGTTWEAYWGSAHESWAYLFLPLRDIEGYRNLFRIREIIRCRNAVERGYPGFATSSLKPGEDGYLDGAGIEGTGSQEIRNNHIFAIYGAFPMLLEFAGRDNPLEENYGLAWLLNMLKGRKMQGPLGAGEAGTNDGTAVAHFKSIDGSFPNIIALTGGLEKETGEMLRHYGVYDDFTDIMEKKYEETFGQELLREPEGFILPSVSVPADKMVEYVCE